MTEPFVSLARYAQLMCIEGCGFWGVSNPDEPQNCSTIWTACERDTLGFFLHEAQHEIEHFVGYPLIKSWFAGERHILKNPISLDWLNLVELGTKTVTDISLCEAVTGGAAQVITIDCAAIAQGLMIPANVVVYHPGTDHVITPSSVTYDTGTDTLTINLPSCVTALENNPDTGWDYSDADSFEDCVDVKVISSTPANLTLISPPNGCSTDCDAETLEVCGYIKSYEMSMVSPSNRCTSGNVCDCRNYQFATVSYAAGLTERDPVLETAVIRLAHSKMPTAPCGCDPIKMNWTRDTHIPDILTPERVNCPCGIADGAWIAWQFIKTKILMRGSGL